MGTNWPRRIADKIAPRMGAEPDGEVYQHLEYGANIVFMNVPKFLVLIAVALPLGLLPSVGVFMLLYAALRLFSFGVHFQSALLCALLGLAYYLGSAYLATNIAIPFLWKAATLCACGCVFLLFSPAETTKRPIPTSQRPRFKCLSMCVLIAITILALRNHDAHPVFSSLCCLAAVCQSINLLPITFKLIRRVEQ